MRIPSCLLRCAAVSVIAAFALPINAHAQVAIPKLIRIVVPFSAGASNDVIGRAIAALLAKRLDTAVIVENKAGAAGVIGADAVAKSPHDGSVLLLTSSTFLTAAATQKQLPYDPIAAFAPVAMVGQGPMLLAISASTPFKSTADVFAAAREKPGAINYGSAGVGSVGHMATELLNDIAKVQMTHVPYKGAANAVVDLAAGQIQVMISSYSTLAPLVKSGKVKTLAVTSRQPHPAFPRTAADRRVGARLRDRHLGRRVRARGNAAGIDRTPQSRDQRDLRIAGTGNDPRAGRNDPRRR
jgi:tripartite-type tricarboxylate transporter receptor subunit TctC